jgi:phosphoribosylformylglycinamidine synthase
MAEACRAFETPVISGNVSFYNETLEEGEVRAIPPTPVIGMVGLLEDVRTHVQPGFKAAGEMIALLGELAPVGANLSVSEHAATVQGQTLERMVAEGTLPPLDLARERAVQEACIRLAEAGVLRSAHDTSDGGFAIALAEQCFSSPDGSEVGATIDLDEAISARSPHVALFNEAPSRILISFHEEHIDKVRLIAEAAQCLFVLIGQTGGSDLIIQIGGDQIVRSPIAELARLWRTSLEARLAA